MSSISVHPSKPGLLYMSGLLTTPFTITLRLTEDVSGELLNVFCSLSKFPQKINLYKEE